MVRSGKDSGVGVGGDVGTRVAVGVGGVVVRVGVMLRIGIIIFALIGVNEKIFVFILGPTIIEEPVLMRSVVFEKAVLIVVRVLKRSRTVAVPFKLEFARFATITSLSSFLDPSGLVLY